MSYRLFPIFALLLCLAACGGDDRPSTAGTAFELSELRSTAEEAMPSAKRSQQRVDELAEELNGARDQALGATREAEKALLEAREALALAEGADASTSEARTTIEAILARLDAIEATLASGGTLAGEADSPLASPASLKSAIYDAATTEDLEKRAKLVAQLKREYVQSAQRFRDKGMEDHVLALVLRERAQEAENRMADLKGMLELFAAEQGYLPKGVTELEAEGYIELGAYEGPYHSDGYIWRGEIENGRFVGTVTADPRSAASPALQITYASDGTALINRDDVDQDLLREELRGELE